MAVDVRSKAGGALLGAAVGDALGAPFEGAAAPAAADVEAIQEATTPLPFTDDTAMTIAFAESLVAVGDLDEDHLADTFVRHWRAEPWRGYGRGTFELLAAIDAGGSWRTLAPGQFGGTGSWGNGAAMRVAPAAIAAGGDIARTRELAKRSAHITHSHPLGVDGAVLQAVAVAVALVTPAAAFDEAVLLDGLRGAVAEPDMLEQLERVAGLPADATSADVAERIGCGIDARSSVPAALAAALRAGGSLADTIGFAIGIGGDTDTIASMAGAITGAHLGAGAIPDRWLRRLEGQDRLEELAVGLVR